MFIAALFTITKIWKQPKCPSTDKWIKKMWIKIYIYDNIIQPQKRMKFCPLQQHGWTGRVFMLSEISQAWKDKYSLISLTCGI